MKIDKKDEKIIVELLNNCRNNNIAIGRKVGLSREGVANRIKKMEEEGIIGGYGINVNFSKLGFIPHEVSIKFQQIDFKAENEFLEHIKTNKKIIFIEKTIGNFDYLIMFMVKSVAELDEELEKLRTIIGVHLKNLNIGAWIANYDSATNFFIPRLESSVSRHSQENVSYQLDNIERALIRELALNSRETAVNLAKKIHVSEITIAKKIKLLIKNKVLKNIRAKINFEKFDVSRYSIYLNVSSDAEQKLSEFCRNNKNIVDFTKFIGRYNYTIEVFAKDNEELKKVVDSILEFLSDSIIDYEILTLLNEVKHVSFWN
jgi:Lrp/AsnC family transcriptional regulator, leucine-responsive regulatory protein